jgi:hypothetical protein
VGELRIERVEGSGQGMEGAEQLLVGDLAGPPVAVEVVDPEIEIPSMRIGRRILVPKAALERFLSELGSEAGND